ncbi:MAG TPA: hypothetical protein ENK44_02255 [Caldithrix abyssi]|uniref:DUF6998 domain-containing protein n=1 Tax=Caldithrix abyssi TaxID=187145 RepID=A0A7V4U0A9_CALAY|nr:hypothetical protein [Caldithrix abyssi]
MNHERFQSIVKSIYAAVNELEKMFPGRPFTPDGHLVGSLGECLVADTYNLTLMSPSTKGYDAITKEGKKVEIKVTQSKRVAFRSCPEHTIIIKINNDGTFVEYFNGPGEIIWKTFSGKKLPKNGQYQISLNKVSKLYERVPLSKRIPKNT